MLKVGVVGLGRGMSLLKTFALHEDAKIVAVCDMLEDKTASVKKEMKLEQAYADYNEFLGHDMDVVVVATPLPYHVSNSIAALESGRHVLSEVPIANSIEECEALVKAVRRSEGKFMFAENCNYWYFVEKWRELIADGELGKPIYAEAEYVHDCRSIMRDSDGNLTWRASMPPIYYCTHSLGPILSIIDDKCVSAVGMNTGVNVAPDLGAIDMEVGLFHTEKGAVIKILCGFSIERKPAFHFYSIYGTKGCLESVRGTDKFAAYFKDSGANSLTELSYGRNHPKAPGFANVGGHGTCEYFMIKAFIESIQKDAKPPIDIYEGLDYSLPGLCAHLSAQQGGKLVEIPNFRLN
jgi:predicted dehydrogenase